MTTRTIHTLIERGPVVFSDADTGRVIVLERGNRLTAWLPCATLGYVQEETQAVEGPRDAGLGEMLEEVGQEAEDFNADLAYSAEQEAA